METSFWHNKWEIDQIGFHRNDVNPLLVNHLEKLKLAKGTRIFLPLCGKTLDIAYLLKNNFKVVGIELSAIAIEALFKELDLIPEISKIGGLKLYQANNIDIYVGDFFELTADILGGVNAIYDRASLIALPLEMRNQYSKHLSDISQVTQQLIICLEYDQEISKGPPFSVTPKELKQHYSKQYDMECVESNYSDNGLKGKHPVTESVWALSAK